MALHTHPAAQKPLAGSVVVGDYWLGYGPVTAKHVAYSGCVVFTVDHDGTPRAFPVSTRTRVTIVRERNL